MFMRKFTLMMTLALLLGSAAWNVASSQTYTYDEGTGVIKYPDQMTVNAEQKTADGTGDGQGVAALIDGDLTTHFHSAYNLSNGSILPDEPHWLQVNMETNLQQIIFKYNGRSGNYHDSWDDVDVYVTNTPEDEDSWKLVAELRDLIDGNPADVELVSPMIDFGAPYRHVRFVVLKCTQERTYDYGNIVNGEANDHKWYFWNATEFQIFPARLVVDEHAKLDLLVADVIKAAYNFEAGTNPGQYPDAVVEEYETAMAEAETLLENKGTDAQYIAAGERINAAVEAALAAQNPFRDGYYYIISGYDQYEAQQGVRKAMYASEDSWLKWQDFSSKDPFQLFKIEKVAEDEDGGIGYSIKNVGTQEYINFIDATSAHVPMSKELVTNQTIKLLPGISNAVIANWQYAVNYHTESHSSGAGKEGYIVPWGSDNVGQSQWKFIEETDQDLIAALEIEGPAKRDAAIMQGVIDRVNKASNLVNEYQDLITKVADEIDDDYEESQYITNAWHNEGRLKYLIDNNTGTHFSSSYSASAPLDEYHNLQVDLREAQPGILFKFTPRNSSYLDFPTDLVIYATNDEALGIDAGSSAEAWVNVTELTKGFPQANTETYTSPRIIFDQPYRYVRFEVRATRSGRKNTTTGYPFYTMSEFHVYSSEPTDQSQYQRVDGMREAYDKLEALIQKAQNDVYDTQENPREAKVNLADTTALLEAYAAVEALYIDRDALDSKYATLRTAANKLYNEETTDQRKLITDADQLNSNAKAPSEGSYANLLDDSNTTIFHSSWTAEAVVDYHNLQIDLRTRPQKDLTYFFAARGSGNHDTPNHFVIYGTNDEELGGDVLSMNDRWTQVDDVNYEDDAETIPNTNAATYTGEIHADQAYRYYRFVVLHTTDQASGRVNGTTQYPYFNLGTFQMYIPKAADEIPYNYDASVKEAADNLKPVLDKANEATAPHTIWPDDLDELQAAYDALLAVSTNTSDLVSTYNTMNTYAENTLVGGEVGYADSQSSVDAFTSAVQQAYESVDADRPTREQINNAIEAMNAAKAALLEHINKIEPNKWYYIVSASTLEYCKDKAMFMTSTNVGSEVNFGQLNENGEGEFYNDPYAMWRLVPVEGTDYYAIQNLGTAHYFGPSLGRGSNYRNKVQNTPDPFRVDYIGQGQLQFVSINDKYTVEDQLHAQQDGSVIVPWPTGINGASCWRVEEVPEDQDIAILIKQNSIRIQTLPFDIPAGRDGLMELNPDVKAYSVKSVSYDEESNTSTVELTLKDDIKAGEPFVMTFGDYTAYDDETSEWDYFYSCAPENVITEATEANGLIGTLDGLTIEKKGLGYIVNSGLQATADAAVKIDGQRGYIDPSKVKTQDGATDLVISCEGLLSGLRIVKVNSAKELVDVYTIDGKLIKKNVKATEAQKGLAKGIYVIGKDKVAVK